MFAIISLSMIPVRKEPSDRSEMVNQLLFGELVEITGKDGNWRKIKSVFDAYVGWVDKKQITSISDKEFADLNVNPTFLVMDLVQIAVRAKNEILPLVIGSSLPFYDGKKFHFGELEYEFDGNALTLPGPSPESILVHSYMYLNAPYLWGGRSPFGIDCSGFTQMVFKLSGIKLNRDAAQQAEQGEVISFIEEAKAGDLAFFDNPEKKIVHVGIILAGNQIIHSSGKVRIDRIDHQGIFNAETNSYSHNLRVIKRIV